VRAACFKPSYSWPLIADSRGCSVAVELTLLGSDFYESTFLRHDSEILVLQYRLILLADGSRDQPDPHRPVTFVVSYPGSFMVT